MGTLQRCCVERDRLILHCLPVYSIYDGVEFECQLLLTSHRWGLIQCFMGLASCVIGFSVRVPSFRVGL
jgi:hypothetical protein